MPTLAAMLKCSYSHACATQRRSSRALPGRGRCTIARGFITSDTRSNTGSFVSRHSELASNELWYGRDSVDHFHAPAADCIAASPRASRSDVRLISCLTNYLRIHKIDLQALFCAEPLLSADSQPMCDTAAGNQAQLLSEYMSAGLRVGEALPHWFVHGNLRGAVKCWLATRPAAEELEQAGYGTDPAAAAASSASQAALAARMCGLGPLGASASLLVDPLLAAMPPWQGRGGRGADFAGWEAAPGVKATAEDVSLLATFGCLVYGARLDVAAFLAQAGGADPFEWAMAQVAQGQVSEPDPWLLERYFMSRHEEGEALPLWFATWGVREVVRDWMQGPQAAALLSHLLEARGAAAPPSPGTAAAIATPAQLAASQPPPAAPDSADSNGNGAHHHQHQHHANTGGIHSSSSSSSAEADDAVARALGALEAALSRSAGGSLAPSPSPSSPSSSSSSSSSSSPSSGWSLHRGAVLADPSDPCRTPHTADLLLRTPGGALLAVAVTLPQHQQHQQQGGGGSGGGDADAASRAVRRGKERLEWLCWLLLQDGGLEPGQVARVLLLAEGGRGGQGGRQQLPAGVLRYLRHSGVQVVWGRELEAGEGEGLGGLGLGALAGAAVQAMAGRRG